MASGCRIDRQVPDRWRLGRLRIAFGSSYNLVEGCSFAQSGYHLPDPDSYLSTPLRRGLIAAFFTANEIYRSLASNFNALAQHSFPVVALWALLFTPVGEVSGLIRKREFRVRLGPRGLFVRFRNRLWELESLPLAVECPHLLCARHGAGADQGWLDAGAHSLLQCPNGPFLRGGFRQLRLLCPA